MRRHEKPYGCTFPQCYRRFGSKNDWKRHENSQHFQMEVWRCNEPQGDGHAGTCGKVCHRREMLRAHLNDEHGISDPVRVDRKAEECRVGRNCEERFWCGFCREIIEVRQKGLSAWTARFNHIDDHFTGRRRQKRAISEWQDVDPRGGTASPSRKWRSVDPELPGVEFYSPGRSRGSSPAASHGSRPGGRREEGGGGHAVNIERESPAAPAAGHKRKRTTRRDDGGDGDDDDDGQSRSSHRKAMLIWYCVSSFLPLIFFGNSCTILTLSNDAVRLWEFGVGKHGLLHELSLLP